MPRVTALQSVIALAHSNLAKPDQVGTLRCVQTPLRQFKGIPKEMLSRLEKKDLAWERYYDLSAIELGELTRFPKLGKQLHRYVHLFPKLDLSATVQPITRSVLRVSHPRFC